MTSDYFSEVAEFIYEPDPPGVKPPLAPFMYLSTDGGDTAYVGRLKEDGSGYYFDGETVFVMPSLWQGDQA